MLKRIKIEYVFLIFYIIFTFILMVYHEPWRDEAQSWLIARDLSFIDIFRQMKYEGHPCLWHLILAPFAKLGFPYRTVNVISWLFGCLSALIIVKESSINKFFLILLFSPIFLYYCSILGRSYSLCLFLVLLLSMIYNKKNDKPVIFNILLLLISNTHILMAAFVGSVILVDIYELAIKQSRYNRKKRFVGLVISIFGFILVFLQLVGCIDSNNQVSSSLGSNVIQNFITFIYHLLLNWGASINLPFIFLFFFYIRKERKIIFIYLLSILFQVFVCVFIYQAGDYVFSLFYLVFIFSCIVFFSNKDKEYKFNNIINIIMAIIFSSMIPLSFLKFSQELKYTYSDSFETAKYIEDNIDFNDNILCISDFKCSAIIPYLSKQYKFKDIYNGDYFTYINWGTIRSSDIDIVSKIIKDDIDYVIHSWGDEKIDSEILNLKNNDILNNVYRTNDYVITDESYEILKVVKE